MFGKVSGSVLAYGYIDQSTPIPRRASRPRRPGRSVLRSVLDCASQRKVFLKQLLGKPCALIGKPHLLGLPFGVADPTLLEEMIGDFPGQAFPRPNAAALFLP